MIHDNLFKDKKELAKYTNNEIYKTLKEYGYKRKGNDFYIDKGELGCVINIQKDRFPSKDEEDFTLNWGVCFPMSAYFYDYRLPKLPTFAKCLVGGRAPWLKNKQDYWWKLTINPTREVLSKVLEEIKYYLESYALPFLNEINTIMDVIEMLEVTKTNGSFHGFYLRHTNPEPFQAILYLFINNKPKAIEIMEGIITTTKSDLYRENMTGLKEKIEQFDPTKYKNSY